MLGWLKNGRSILNFGIYYKLRDIPSKIKNGLYSKVKVNTTQHLGQPYSHIYMNQMAETTQRTRCRTDEKMKEQINVDCKRDQDWDVSEKNNEDRERIKGHSTRNVRDGKRKQIEMK